ncbi:hypothetical protein AB3662_06760 [Sorangium cellulosum]|uniref:hypothetical protein n=1 Tax=Sorangium cellulosum TaxID=56 RepID=UPI003D9A23BD
MLTSHPPVFSVLTTVARTSGAGSSLVRRTHAETLQLAVAFGKLSTAMNSPSPRCIALPNRPSCTHVPPVSSPSRMLPEESSTTVPSPSSNVQCATMPWVSVVGASSMASSGPASQAVSTSSTSAARRRGVARPGGLAAEGGIAVVTWCGICVIYSITVSDPHEVYYLNDSPTVGHDVFIIDHLKTISIRGGATVSLLGDGQNDRQIANFKGLVVEGVPPAPEPVVGQFIRLDVQSVEAAQP